MQKIENGDTLEDEEIKDAINALKNAEANYGTTTAISAVKAAMQQGTPVYNVKGLRVGANYKGMVIFNGRKVMMK